MNETEFFKTGWCRFATDPEVTAWVRHALPDARRAVTDPALAEWLRCGGTWFAGVHALDNDEHGALAGGPPLSGQAIAFIQDTLGLRDISWDQAQISVCYPGYPKPMVSEPEPAFRYRHRRDAAHVDGLRREDPGRRRHLREHHGFILGLPLVAADREASPLVVWEGSHQIMRRTFRARFAGLAPQDWCDEDVTEAYHAARRETFDNCRRVIVHAVPGESYLVHRLALHGMAPWGTGATAGADGRMIAYFRPEIGGPRDWLEAP